MCSEGMVETRSGKMQDPAQERIQAEESAKPQPGVTIGRDASSDPVVLNPNIDIPKYDGTEDPRPWIESLEEIGFLYHWADYIISRYAAMNMTGSAKTWLNLHKASFTSWENIKIRLIQDFSLDANKEELRMKLNRMQHWNEPAIRFAEDILVLCNKVDPAMEEETKIEHVIGGLKKEYSFALYLNPPKTTDDLLVVCKKMDSFEKKYRERVEKSRNLYNGPRYSRPQQQSRTRWKKLDMVGSIFLNIKIDDETLSHNFVILKTHLRTLILGRDFLKKMNAKIDCKQETIKYDLTNNHDEINFEMLKIKSAKDSIVPECSMKLIKALVETEDGEYIIEESSKMFQTNGLRLARSLINVINRETHIWITNPYPRPLKIMKNQTLAFGSSPAKINVSRERKVEKNEEPRFQINENLSPKEQKELKQVLERTISRRLVANGLHSCSPLRRLPLTPPNRRQRLEWCRARSTWMTEWHRVVFSDESRFCLSSDSRRVRVWRRRGERSNPAAIVERPTVRQRGIMVWGAIAYDSRSPLLRIQGTMTAQRYVDDVLRPVTLPYLQGVPNALYQQDNARPHTARISQQALQDVQMLPWPPYSPDLSPIEHVWDIIGRRLHALPQPRSEDELWQMVEREWRAIPQDAIRTLIDSLPRRVAACIAVRGGPTCY
ncbi:Transposase [Cordylochernes scorpioides]|uniref:Transposase n=1 Tax=Cordylochernes scorpioides TaxID=51811 RepID=A0ABY6KE67_9ARAC|nr:Transposase [Cordylochernes scorpioides]